MIGGVKCLFVAMYPQSVICNMSRSAERALGVQAGAKFQNWGVVVSGAEDVTTSVPKKHQMIRTHRRNMTSAEKDPQQVTFFMFVSIQNVSLSSLVMNNVDKRC